MITKTVTTKASGVEYEVPVNQFESLTEAREYWEAQGENSDDVELGIINGAMEQNGKQGDKTKVRDAVSKFGADSPEVEEAIGGHQKSSGDYIIGKPRGGKLADGSTKTEIAERSKSAAENPEALAELQAIYAKYGV
jgi:hypothetical protein